MDWGNKQKQPTGREANIKTGDPHIDYDVPPSYRTGPFRSLAHALATVIDIFIYIYTAYTHTRAFMYFS